MKFECPKCGSYKFGSIQNDDGTLTRYCNGKKNRSCNFEFHERDDDKYFTGKTTEIIGAIDIKKYAVNKNVEIMYYDFMKMVLSDRIEAKEAWKILLTPLCERALESNDPKIQTASSKQQIKDFPPSGSTDDKMKSFKNVYDNELGLMDFDSELHRDILNHRDIRMFCYEIVKLMLTK